MMKPHLLKLLTLLRNLLPMALVGFNVTAFALTIDDAFNKAIEVDPSLRSSRFNQQAVAENVAIARSRLLPQIMLQGASNNLTQTTTQDVVGAASVSRSFTGPSVNHQFLIRQGLIRPKELSALNLAELQNQYGEVKYLSDLSEVWYRVANAYIDVVGAQQIAEAYAKPLANMLLAAKQEKARFENGDGTKDAANEAEAQYQQAKSSHIQALHSLWAKQRSFGLLTQIEPALLKDVKLSLKPEALILKENRDQLWLRVKENSFELRLAEYQEAMQKQRLRMAESDHLPTLDLIAAWNIAKNDATSTQGYKYKNNQIGIQYTIPIFAGGGISAGERQAKNSLESTLADSVVISNKIENDFTIFWSAVQGFAARIDSGYLLIESAKTQQKAIELSYIHGVKTIMEMANTDLMLSRRIVDQINLVVDFKKYSIKLSKKEKDF